MDNRSTLEFILFAGLISSMEEEQREIMANDLLEAGFSSSTYNQAVFLNHLYQNHIITIKRGNFNNYDSDNIDLNDNYRVKLRFTNDDDDLKELISQIKSTHLNENRAALSDIVRRELVGEVFTFFANRVTDLNIEIDLLAEPPLIITKLLEDLSVLEVCGCIEKAVNKFNRSKIRILKCASDNNELVNTVFNAINSQDRYHFTVRPTETSNLMYLLTEHLTEIGPDYWKNGRLWRELEDIEAKL